MASSQTTTLGALTLTGLLTVANVAITTGTFTTGNFTTVNATTVEATTLSGAYQNAAGTATINTAGLAEFATLSGATLRTTAGDTVINDSFGIESIDTISGAVIDAATLSGEHLNIKSTSDGVACVTSGSKLGICSSAVGAGGDCTCTAL